MDEFIYTPGSRYIYFDYADFFLQTETIIYLWSKKHVIKKDKVIHVEATFLLHNKQQQM